jgi:hypothetical protein
MKIIGLSGPKGAGKTSVACAITRAAVKKGIRPITRSFAKPLKDMVETLMKHAGFDEDDIAWFSMPENKELPIAELGGKSMRHAWETLGTEWGRVCMSPTLWSDIGLNGTKDCDLIIFDDVRFEEEASAVRRRGGIIVEVQRPDHSFEGYHRSAQRNVLPDYIFLNNQSEVSEDSVKHFLTVSQPNVKQ